MKKNVYLTTSFCFIRLSVANMLVLRGKLVPPEKHLFPGVQTFKDKDFVYFSEGKLSRTLVKN